MKKTETKSTVLLASHLKSLRLPTFLAKCEKATARWATNNVDHLALLLQLCAPELINRDQRASDRRLKDAKFPNRKAIDTFDFRLQPSLSKVLVSELMKWESIDKRESRLLVGKSGIGKTHLATAYGIAVRVEGKRDRYSRITNIVIQPMAAHVVRHLLRL